MPRTYSVSFGRSVRPTKASTSPAASRTPGTPAATATSFSSIGPPGLDTSSALAPATASTMLRKEASTDELMSATATIVATPSATPITVRSVRTQ